MPAKWEQVICSWWSCNWVLLHFNPIKSRTHCDAVARERWAVGRLHLSPVQVGRHCWQGHNPLKLRRRAQSIIQVSFWWDIIRFYSTRTMFLFSRSMTDNDKSAENAGAILSILWRKRIIFDGLIIHFFLRQLYIPFYLSSSIVFSIFKFHLNHVNVR